MLVLSRKEGDRIILQIDPSMVDREIVLTQVRIGPNTSRIGIDAPPGVIILREELVEETAWT